MHLANFYHAKSGGIKTYLDKKRDYFKSIGLPFRMIIPDEQDNVEEQEGDSVIYRIGSREAPLNPLYKIIWNLPAVHQIIKREKPDLIEVNDKFTLAGLALIYRKLVKLPYTTAGFHHERFDTNLFIYWKDSKLVSKLANLFMQVVSACFDKIICASRYTAEEIEPIAPDKIEVINLGTDIDVFHPDLASPLTHKLYAKGADKLLVYVGRLAKEKNLGILPPMMQMLQERGINARLVVAGVGQDENILTDSGRKDINLIGFVSDRDEMAKILASADAMVFPSEKEPYGLVPLEALSSGLPVVCSDQGGVLEYSNCEAVRSVRPTARNFADAVEELLSIDRDTLRKTARSHAVNFSWQNTFEKQLELYKRMITNGNGRITPVLPQ